jgi:hypothetical protein
VGWQSAPVDMQSIGFKGMMVIHLPVKREWGEAERARVAQNVANAAVAAVRAEEDR